MRLKSILLMIMLFLINITVIGCGEATPTAIEASPTFQEEINTPARTSTAQAPLTPALTLTPLVNFDLQLISPASDDPRMSDDGRYIVYIKYVHNIRQIAVKDRVEPHEILISSAPDGTLGNGHSVGPSISGNGQIVAFISFATNLEPSAKEDCTGTGNCGALYIYDLSSKNFEHVAVGAADQIGPSTTVSADGHFVAFAVGWSRILQGVFLYDRGLKEVLPIHQIDVSNSPEPAAPGSNGIAIAGDGRFVAFVTSDDGVVPQDHNGVSDVFLYDRMTGQIERISVPTDGIESGQPSGSYLSGLVYRPSVSISSDGRYISFLSAAPNLVEQAPSPCADYSGEQFPGCVHIYLLDRQTQTIELVSLADSGTLGNAPSEDASISDDGRFVIFTSFATNLTSFQDVECPAGNYCPQVYLRDRREKHTYMISLGAGHQLPNGPSLAGDITADGQFVVYSSAATNLIPDTPDGGTYFTNLLSLLGLQE